MLELAAKIAGSLIVVSILSMYIGFLIGRVIYKRVKPSYEINPILRKPGNIYNKPFILGSPRPTGKDDLKVIEGIDISMENKLNQLGIFHIEQISKWNEKNIEWVDEYFSLEGKVTEDNWVSQAKEMLKK